MSRSLSAPSVVDRSDGSWVPVGGFFSKAQGSMRPTTGPMLRGHGAGGTVRAVEEKSPVVSPLVSEVTGQTGMKCNRYGRPLKKEKTLFEEKREAG